MRRPNSFICWGILMLTLTIVSSAETEPFVVKQVGAFEVGGEAGLRVRSFHSSPTGTEILVETWEEDEFLNVIGLAEDLTKATLSKRSRTSAKWENGERIEIPSRTFKDERILIARGLVRASTELINKGDVFFESESGRMVKPGNVLCRYEVIISGIGIEDRKVPLDGLGDRVFKSTDSLWYTIIGQPGVKHLFWVKGRHRTRITTEEYPMVREFAYDKIKNRIAAIVSGKGDVDTCTVVYDMDIGLRRILAVYDPDTETELKYYLVPGKDYLLMQRADLDPTGNDYTGMSLKLCDLRGEVLSDVPLSFSGSLDKLELEDLLVSQHLLAVRVADYRKRVIKVFSLENE